ncbi:MAG: hypothetical protein KQA41_01735 [Candidatus Aenigmarchaeota archaeon]|nr:hypothetical protein [Candidatus Aenigmarchaeota archaeon]
MKVVLEIESKNAEKIKKSLEQDVINNKNTKIKFKIDKNKLKIEIIGDKPSHIKGIINSYLTLINVLNDLE